MEKVERVIVNRLLTEHGEDVPLEVRLNLPEGAYWTEDNQNLLNVENLNFVEIGKFYIDVANIAREDLKRLRKYFPKREYIALKNRKTARMQREKNKSKLSS